MDEIINLGQKDPVGLHLDENAKSHLKETAKWTKLLSIVGFVTVGFLILFGLVMMFSIGSLGDKYSQISGMGSMGAVMGIVYILMAGLYLYPILKLYHFSDFAKKALASHDSHMLTQALEAQKSMYKFMGILTVIVLAIYAIIIVFTLIGLAAFVGG